MEIWDEVIKEYNDELNKLKNTLGDGNAENYSHYRQLVGHIYGIEWCRTTLTTIIKNRFYDEEE
jgi:hypothetical protein